MAGDGLSGGADAACGGGTLVPVSVFLPALLRSGSAVCDDSSRSSPCFVLQIFRRHASAQYELLLGIEY